jgi:hypothetical protein
MQNLAGFGSLRIVRGLQSRGIFLLGNEISPHFVIASLAFFDPDNFPKKDIITVVNSENLNDRITIKIPGITNTPIKNLRFERL